MKNDGQIIILQYPNGRTLKLNYFIMKSKRIFSWYIDKATWILFFYVLNN